VLVDDRHEGREVGENTFTLLGLGNVGSRGVALLGTLLAATAGEEDEALLVLLKTSNVGLQALLGKVLAAGIDRDTDGGSELAGDASFLIAHVNAVLAAQ